MIGFLEEPIHLVEATRMLEKLHLQEKEVERLSEAREQERLRHQQLADELESYEQRLLHAQEQVK